MPMGFQPAMYKISKDRQAKSLTYNSLLALFCHVQPNGIENKCL